MKLPKTVYVARHGTDTREEYLAVDETAGHLIEDDGPTIVGTYQLVETRELTKQVVAVDAVTSR